jgi:hypothetical protein
VTDGSELVAYRGEVLPENTHYHTLFAHADDAMAVVSTERFDLDGGGEWQALPVGVHRRSVPRA